jgi:hypothetical protein
VGDDATRERQLRVALVGCSGLLGDIIEHTVNDQPDIDVVARLAAPGPGSEVPDLDADIVVWNEAEETHVAEWLMRRPRVGPRVLATLVDGQRAALWELTPQRTELGAPSPAILLQTIRDRGRGAGSGRP